VLIRLLSRQLSPYRRFVATILVLLLGVAVANLFLPNLTADIINNGVVKGDLAYIWRAGGVMLGISVVVAVLQVVGGYFAARVAMGVGRDLRGAIFANVQRFGAQEMNRFGAASLITRNTNDVQQLQIFVVMLLTIMASAPITAVGGVIMALYENAKLSLLLVVVIPLMAGVIGTLLRFAVPLFRVVQVRIDRINQVLREQITGVRVVRAFVRGGYERKRFEQANDELTGVTLRVTRIFAVTLPSIMLLLNLSSIAVIWFGGHQVDAGEMPIGNLLAFLNYLMLILMSVMMAAMLAVLVPRAGASAERIVQVLDTKASIAEPDDPKTPAERTGAVEFRDVTFTYPGAERAVLSGVTFTMRPGQTTAIIGSTGSGKTTIANLLTRFFDVSEGAVLVDGVDVREQRLQELWEGIGLVPQQAYLFASTVGANLRLGAPDATDDELWHALEVAQARDFVEAMPERLDEMVAQGGTTVSGGQRQRLAIARALVRRPRVYVFDDAFSALDAGTDARLRAALRGETANSAVLLISQRVSTIRHADQIVVIDEGRVVGIGTHAELVASNETYREIVDSQLRGEEQVA
jgi:ATP-binding cassette, subfamily B, multidrug efflux pump